MAKLLLIFALATFYLEGIHGHGMLMEPVNRGSAWRKGFNTPVNYDDDGNYCGGLFVQIKNGGKCGLCGDDYKIPPPRANENGGLYGTGTIVQTYKAGQMIELVGRITANHMGYMRYSICPLKHGKELETEECFAKYMLKMADGTDRYVLPSHETGDYKMSAYLPQGLTCEHCVLRWEYTAGNNWGKCEDGTHKMGCGPQETFKSCSDIRIVA
ncbi:hypothetical protein DMN91_003714 [Ooceraea biroi]|uniref:Chitin-binding type-4 domain-containing protein n=1 Tax=Ooceraea biroi TaxID=2015173 RepID=A0A026X217_OOCBI|nr:uncharacterized protein LOC105284115 [Ooceraea biroi]EZA61439.1 hypothetical protein X777_07772 [Ooceraea biroi]RLU23509.1 hypothetical protein DMN91_003714 [Ooceraea biroi]